MIKRTPTGDLQRETIMAALSASIARHDGDIKALAEEAGISPSTIRNVLNEKTAWPRPATLFGLCHSLGLRLQLHNSKGA